MHSALNWNLKPFQTIPITGIKKEIDKKAAGQGHGYSMASQ